MDVNVSDPGGPAPPCARPRQLPHRAGDRPPVTVSTKDRSTLKTLNGGETHDAWGERLMTLGPGLMLATLGGTLAYLGLAVLSRGGFAAFFSQPALTVVAVAMLVMAGAACFSQANLNPGEREDRGNRWVLIA